MYSLLVLIDEVLIFRGAEVIYTLSRKDLPMAVELLENLEHPDV